MPDTGFRLREATPEDAETIARLLTELGHPTVPADVPGRLAAVLGEGGAVVLAVEASAEPLGLLCLARHAVLHAPGPVAYITALVTTAAARRRGVGRALVTAATRWARQRGCVRLTVTSAEHRADAHAFYPACGLPYTGRRFSAPVPARAT
jgi:GNAT superfamily N-acetyltransferase